MGLQAIRAVLYSLFRIGEIAAAAIPQGVQGAVTKQAAKVLRIRAPVAGKVLAVLILKKIVICHSILLFRFANALRCDIIESRNKQVIT